jgi:predicted DCC family thiol-disulfide oxidoreductase YuxK|tara:strand:- start:235 stop:621 length:387 start_codon:yes stop_codon:yes gene_type:complete
MKSKIVIYYDGICFVCSSAINALIKMDKNNILYFSPLQSNYAKSSINKKFLKEMDSVIVRKNEKVFSKSYAAFVVLRELRSPLRYLFYLVPTFFADFIYDFIAKRRYSWFGKKEECIFPIDNPKFLID